MFHRPLFRHLGLVTVRTFETFYADALPVLMPPRDLVAAIYGESALKLVPGESLAEHLTTALERPEDHWDAVPQTRATWLGTIPSHSGCPSSMRSCTARGDPQRCREPTSTSTATISIDCASRRFRPCLMPRSSTP